MKTLLVLLILLFPSLAHAGRYWVTARVVGTGASLEDARRPDIGPFHYVLVADDGDEMLVLVTAAPKDLPALKAVAKYHGAESTKKGKRVISATLWKKIRAEAERLGNAGFDPRAYNVAE